MWLVQARVVGVGPLADITFRFAEDGGAPRKLTVVMGGGGVGKTSLLAAIASTRPGYAAPQLRPRVRAASSTATVGATAPPPPFVVTDWLLGEDDRARPHPLRVASPNAVLDEAEDESALRRREQSHFDRLAVESGFACIAFSGGRWFSRSPVLLSTPERTVARYDVRAPASFDDATRADLARDAKTALSFAAIGAALAKNSVHAHARRSATSTEAFDCAMREAVAPLARLSGVAFVGVDPLTLDPIFEIEATHRIVGFDELATSARHLIAFAALTVRTLYAARPDRDPRRAEGLVLIDDVDVHQDAQVRRGIAGALREALPNVQWILTASSPEVTLGCAPSEVLALRRMTDAQHVELYEGDLALVH